MFAENALELIKELDRSKEILLPFKENAVRAIIEETKVLWNLNRANVSNEAEKDEYAPTVYLRHGALNRNKRLLLAYLYHRLEKIKLMRWEFGSVLPDDIKINLSEPETLWFNNYSKNLTTYMRQLGDKYHSLDLTQNLSAPRSVLIEVTCSIEYGDLRLPSGEVILLRPGCNYQLPLCLCEHLIRQGILEPVKIS